MSITTETLSSTAKPGSAIATQFDEAVFEHPNWGNLSTELQTDVAGSSSISRNEVAQTLREITDVLRTESAVTEGLPKAIEQTHRNIKKYTDGSADQVIEDPKKPEAFLDEVDKFVNFLIHLRGANAQLPSILVASEKAKAAGLKILKDKELVAAKREHQETCIEIDEERDATIAANEAQRTVERKTLREAANKITTSTAKVSALAVDFHPVYNAVKGLNANKAEVDKKLADNEQYVLACKDIRKKLIKKGTDPKSKLKNKMNDDQLERIENDQKDLVAQKLTIEAEIGNYHEPDMEMRRALLDFVRKDCAGTILPANVQAIAERAVERGKPTVEKIREFVDSLAPGAERPEGDYIDDELDLSIVFGLLEDPFITTEDAWNILSFTKDVLESRAKLVAIAEQESQAKRSHGNDLAQSHATQRRNDAARAWDAAKSKAHDKFDVLTDRTKMTYANAHRAVIGDEVAISELLTNIDNNLLKIFKTSGLAGVYAERRELFVEVGAHTKTKEGLYRAGAEETIRFHDGVGDSGSDVILAAELGEDADAQTLIKELVKGGIIGLAKFIVQHTVAMHSVFSSATQETNKKIAHNTEKARELFRSGLDDLKIFQQLIDQGLMVGRNSHETVFRLLASDRELIEAALEAGRDVPLELAEALDLRTQDEKQAELARKRAEAAVIISQNAAGILNELPDKPSKLQLALAWLGFALMPETKATISPVELIEQATNAVQASSKSELLALTKAGEE